MAAGDRVGSNSVAGFTFFSIRFRGFLKSVNELSARAKPEIGFRPLFLISKLQEKGDPAD